MDTYNLYVWKYPKIDLVTVTKELSYAEATDISNKLLSTNMDVDSYISPSLEPVHDQFIGATITVLPKDELLRTFL